MLFEMLIITEDKHNYIILKRIYTPKIDININKLDYYGY